MPAWPLFFRLLLVHSSCWGNKAIGFTLADRFAGGQHVARGKKACTHGGGVVVADEVHMPFESPAVCFA